MRNTLTALLLLLGSAALWGARVDTIQIDTKYLGSPEKVVVITPKMQGGQTSFPTVYLLNGYDGDHTQWLKDRPDLPEMADRLGLVLVMPDGRNSWYWDNPGRDDMQMESFFVNDLVPYIDRHYPTRAVREQRAIMGLSMGGQGAMYLAMRHPDVWSGAGSTSGGLDIRPFPNSWHMKDVLGEMSANPDVWAAHSPAVLAESLEPGSLNLLIDCGKDDFFAGVNEEFHQILTRRGIDHDYIVRPGRHSHQYWNNSVPYHLWYFYTHFYPQPGPVQ